ncbi:MAG: SufS family cysteine desulfurase [Verrucomicrobiales bacterium]|nr:SufS family cysteine desulfurase [Verrucomicrobiales bacterium]
MPSFDQETLRADFPVLLREVDGKPLAYLDSGATAQKPRCVIDAMGSFLSERNANIHRGVHFLSRNATEAYEASRQTIKAALQVPDTHELIFVRGTTEGINLVAHGLEEKLVEGDEIVLTIMEHHANFVPWQILAERCGVKLHFAGLKEDGSLDMEEWKSFFNERTRFAAFTHISNVLGTINPVADMVSFARERGVETLVDGAQALPHGPVDLGTLNPDFYVFSGHKVFGPDGIGVLIGDREKLNSFRPYQSGGDMIQRVSVNGTTFRDVPERFEAGTPNISGAIGLAAAFQYLSEIDWKLAFAHEENLRSRLSSELEKTGDVKIFGSAEGKAAIVSFFPGFAHPHDVGTILDSAGVAVRDGHHCAQPLMDYFGVPATVRASIAFYNNDDDIDAFLEGMAKAQRFLA